MESLINRFDQIDEFLVHLSSYALSNKNIEINTNFVYANLVKINVSIDQDISQCFSLWIEQFKYKKNIKVYQKNSYCYFDNNKEEIIDNNCFKIYIPQDEKHIYKSVNLIFNYLQEKNITHVSKVANSIRNDNVIIRVNTKEDANNINNFIKDNDYIKEGLLSPNPFMYSYNNIAYAIDRRVIYNNEVAFLISSYFNYLKEENRLSTAGSQGFRTYCVRYFNDTFKYGTNLKQFISKKELIEKTYSKEGIKYYKLDQLVNYKDTMSLIIKAIDTKNDFLKFMNHYEVLNSKEYNFEASESINELLEEVYGSKDYTEPFLTLKDKERIMQESIISTIKKYNMTQGKIALQKYITEGNVSDFTRDNNARANMQNILTPTEAVKIIKNFFSGELNINDYVEITMNINLTKIKRELLDRAIIETIKEKGILHIKKTINKLIRTQNLEDIKKISRNNDARRNFYKFIELNELETLMKQTLLDNKLPGSLVQEKYIDLYLQRLKKDIEEVELDGIIEHT